MSKWVCVTLFPLLLSSCQGPTPQTVSARLPLSSVTSSETPDDTAQVKSTATDHLTFAL